VRGGFPNIRHMRLLLETTRLGSVSAAAEACHLSQPAASQAISRLEADIGTALLVRNRKPAQLTQSGTLFVARATKALEHLKKGSQAALREADAAVRRTSTFEMSVTASQLRNLIAIANTGNFTVAANTTGLSQPSVHRAARSLEEAIGLPLFVARPSGVRLTPAAERFVVSVKLAQAELRQGLEEISHTLGREKGTFVLGSLPLARTTIVPKTIHSMVSSVDGFQVSVVEGRYAELLRSLREGDIDCLIGALRHPAPAEDVQQEHLFRDALSIVAHPSHPLVGKKGVHIDETLDFPWIAPPKETPAGQYLFETLRIEDRRDTPVRVVSSSMAILRGVLAEGPYLSVVSRHQINVDEDLGAISALDIDLTGHIRDIGLTYRQGWRPTETQHQFIGFLRRFSRFAEDI